MKNVKQIQIAIVSSSFRQEITEQLEKNCLETLKKKGLKESQINVFRAPGAFEIPLIAKKLAKKRKYDAIIAFGAILKGKTYHFEQISNECARAIMQLSLKYELPIIFEVLSVYKIKDAQERAAGKKENKGREGALTALKMIEIISRI